MVCWGPSKDSKFGHFTSLFHRGRQANMSKWKRAGVHHVQTSLFFLVTYANFWCPLFFEAHNFPRASLSENCSLLGTDNVRGQISEHIFAPNEGYCLYIHITQVALDANQVYRKVWRRPLTREPKLPWRQTEKEKQWFYALCTSIFHFTTLHYYSRPLHDVNWFVGKFQISSFNFQTSPFAVKFQRVRTHLLWKPNDLENEKLHFEITFSL